MELLETKEDLELCYEVFKQLRPHLTSKEMFISQVNRQQLLSYQIIAIKNSTGQVVSAAGFRITEFLAWGKVLYIDDLITSPDFRGKGYGSSLLDWLIEKAKSEKCQALHLDTGYTRHDAHKLYLKADLKMKGHHLSIEF